MKTVANTSPRWAARIPLLVLGLAALAGCSLAPGMSMGIPRGVPVVQIDAAWPSPMMPTAQASWPAALLLFRPGPYRIEAGDRIRLVVWDHPEFSPAGSNQSSGIVLAVHEDGTIRPPFIGKVQARGRTLGALREDVASRYASFYAQDLLEMELAAVRGTPITVRGAFRKTDPIRLDDEPMSLARMLAMASIDESTADVRRLHLVRDGETFELDLEAPDAPAGQLFLKPGDAIHLPSRDRRQVYVGGEVLRPAAIPIGSSLDLAAALAQAGGIHPDTASASRVYVVRAPHGASERPIVYRLNADSVEGLAYATQFPLEAGDHVLVGTAAVARWGRFFRQLVPFGNVVRNAAATGTN